ncbi:MAG: acyl-CoA dehydrogenase family protein, partial [Steroidobacteraceae bacterium]
DTVRTFVQRELEPVFMDLPPRGPQRRELWRRAGSAGILGACIPEEYGGAGASTLCNVILSYELGRSPSYATIGSFVATDLATSVLVSGGSDGLLRKWSPKILAGEAIQCLALTEAGAGSDATAIRATAVRDGDDYVINGAKVFITNADFADIIYVVAKTDPKLRGKGMSIFLVESDRAGVTQRPLKTMGFPSGNTGEVHLDNVRVPAENLLGGEGGAFKLLMSSLASDRLQIGGRALAQAELALEITVDYVKQRKAFGQALVEFQNTQIKLAEAKADIEAGRAFFYQTVRKVRAGQCSEADTAMMKVWLTEMSGRVIDLCLQFWGGAGFMDEMTISRLYTSNRVLRIYGGTSEILKLLVARSL